jgi:K+-sensing histidine kinase KdpD
MAHADAWCRADSHTHRALTGFELDGNMGSWNAQLKWLSPVLGTAVCAATAGLLSVIFRDSPFNTALPFCFLAMVVFVATRFGFVAGLLGTILAEAIFAFFMFRPLYSLSVQSHAARNSLLWMFFGGLALSELFSHHPPDPGKPRFRPNAGA